MAQKVTVALEDDIDGGPADETVRFGLEGTDYEIDLSAKNASAFRKKLTPFIEHARRAGRGQARRPARTAASRQRSGDIRAWAKSQGLEVSERGRIPASVVEQYNAATKGRLSKSALPCLAALDGFARPRGESVMPMRTIPRAMAARWQRCRNGIDTPASPRYRGYRDWETRTGLLPAWPLTPRRSASATVARPRRAATATGSPQAT